MEAAQLFQAVIKEVGIKELCPNLQDVPLVSWDLGGGRGEEISVSFYTGLLPWDACNMKAGFKECGSISFVF